VEVSHSIWRGLRFDKLLFMSFAEPPAGGIDLTAARVAGLVDSEATWPSCLWLRGCVYSEVEAAEDVRERPRHDSPRIARLWWRVRPGGMPDVKRRLRWIRLAEECQLAETRSDGYAQQPYTQLMAHYRQEGRDGDARQVAYERERRRRGQLHPPGQVWNVFLRWTVGYGYKPLRAVVLLGFLVLGGALAFSSFHDHGEIRAIRNEHPPLWR
jgi:hypothetical protein